MYVKFERCTARLSLESLQNHRPGRNFPRRAQVRPRSREDVISGGPDAIPRSCIAGVEGADFASDECGGVLFGVHAVIRAAPELEAKRPGGYIDTYVV